MIFNEIRQTKIWSSDIFSATLYHTLSELLLNGSDTAKQFIEAQRASSSP